MESGKRAGMNHGLSDQVRSVAADKYVEPAIRAGKLRFSVAVRDLMRDLEPMGFPARNWPQICTAIQAEKFLRAHRIEIEAVDGPPKKQSPTVVVRYRVQGASAEPASAEERASSELKSQPEEDPAARALRLTEKLRGLLKEEFAAYGGGEAFLRWVRSEDEDAV
jgi:hypothetical protein